VASHQMALPVAAGSTPAKWPFRCSAAALSLCPRGQAGAFMKTGGGTCIASPSLATLRNLCSGSAKRNSLQSKGEGKQLGAMEEMSAVNRARAITWQAVVARVAPERRRTPLAPPPPDLSAREHIPSGSYILVLLRPLRWHQDWRGKRLYPPCLAAEAQGHQRFFGHRFLPRPFRVYSAYSLRSQIAG